MSAEQVKYLENATQEQMWEQKKLSAYGRAEWYYDNEQHTLPPTGDGIPDRLEREIRPQWRFLARVHAQGHGGSSNVLRIEELPGWTSGLRA